MDGHVERADEFRRALAAAPFASVRGTFRFNTNHFPIQSFYLSKVVRQQSGALGNALQGMIVKDLADASAKESQVAVGQGVMPVRADAYVGTCKMR